MISCVAHLSIPNMFDTVSYQDKGIGVISASPLSMALLTHQGPPVWHPGSDEIKNACRNADKLCQVSFAIKVEI